MRRYLSILLLFIGLVYSHRGVHMPITPYISPGIQIGYDGNKIFFSYQFSFGIGYKTGDHFEDTLPLFIGKTFGVRYYFQKKKSKVRYIYEDTQISFVIVGAGIGKIVNKEGESFKKTKYWLGTFGLLSYEKIFFYEKTQNHYGVYGVFPIPLYQLIRFELPLPG